MKSIVAGLAACAFRAIAAADCKCSPEEACWPSIDEWAQLNSTVEGRLVATVPLGEPCHDPEFNATQCDYLKDHWDYVDIQ